MNIRAKTAAALVKAKVLIEMRYPEPTVVWFCAPNDEAKARVEEAAGELGLKPESFRVFVNGTLGDCPQYQSNTDKQCVAPISISGRIKV